MASAHRRAERSELAQKIQDRWIELSAEDIDYIGIDRNRLIERLAERYTMTRAQAESQIRKWERKLVLPAHCARLRSAVKTPTKKRVHRHDRREYVKS